MGAENNIRVLIFEDNNFLRCTLKDFLGDFGYEVFTFEDPVASPLYKKNYCDCRTGKTCADIIISDVNMPCINGLDFIRGQIQKGCKVKSRALMSGDWTHTNLQIARNLGCRIFTKPFDIIEKIKQNEKIKRIGILSAIAIIAIIATVFIGMSIGNNNIEDDKKIDDTTTVSTGSQIFIPISEIGTSTKFYSYESNGIDIKYFIVNPPELILKVIQYYIII